MSIDDKALADGYQVVAPSMSYGIYRAAVRAYEATKSKEQQVSHDGGDMGEDPAVKTASTVTKEQPDERTGLLPCPFCGGPGIEVGGDPVFVMCGAPRSFESRCPCSRVQTTKTIWNTRPPKREISWQPKYVEQGHSCEEIVRSVLLEKHVYLQGKNGDVWRVWLDFTGHPSIECTEYNAALPTNEIEGEQP